MPSLPALTTPIRILLLDDELSVARPILAHLSQAGLDCRYAPSSGGASTVAQIEPHLIVLGVAAPDAAAQQTCIGIRRVSAVPLIVMCPQDYDRATACDPGADDYLPRPAPPHAVLSHAVAVLRRVYPPEQVLALDEVAPATDQHQVPPGWGRCGACGYIGPRQKFTNPDRQTSHSLVCPACHRSTDILFSV